MPHVRLLVVVACLLTFAHGGCDNDDADDDVVRREGEPDYFRDKDDPAMDRAVRKARETHKSFIAALQQPKPGYRRFAVKKGFPTPDGGREHMWVTEPKWDGAQFRGVVSNEPVDTKAVKRGDRVTVTPAELSDWMYVDGNKLVGGYTLRVLHYQQPPERQREYVDRTGLEVPPVDF